MHQSHSRKTISFLLLFFVSLFGSLFAHTVYAQEDLLAVDDAFQLQSPSVENGHIQLHWKIADGYYLYKKRVAITADKAKLGSPEFSPSKVKNDPAFGKSDVFVHNLDIKQPFESEANSIKLTVKYQGCAEAQGVCYPPQTRMFDVSLPSKTDSSNSFNSLSDLNALIEAGASEDELLPPDQAFQLNVEGNGTGALRLQFNVASGYHLYKDKITVTLTQGEGKLGAPQMPTAVKDNDPVFGNVEVYKAPFEVTVPVSQAMGTISVQVGYQGCSDTLGVCYPPETKSYKITADSIGSGASSASKMPSSAQKAPMETSNANLSETDQITQTLQNSSVWIVIGTFFVFGLLLSLTPCVFPMIPILSSIIAGQGSNITTRKAFGMSLVYVLAMSVTYTVAGVLAGLFGENLQAMFQNPWIIGSFALIFVALAFSMFGFYELQLPSSLQSKITQISNKQEGGSTLGVAIMGFLSALIVGPCVAPPLAGALIYIGQTGDAFLGGSALFAMSLGMGVPLLLVGISAGKLLPKAGAWMDNVKAIFGVLMLGVAIWMAERILPASITLFLWSALLIGSAVYLGALDAIGDKSGWHKLAKSLGVLLLLMGAMMLAGTLGGSKDALQPLGVFQGGHSGSGATKDPSELAFTKINTLDELKTEVAKGQPIMLDFYADWCVSCKEMEKFTFSDPKVQAALKNVTLLKADVTENNADDKALMKAFGIIGPPAILFFNNGDEQKASRVVGFKNAEDFRAIIEKAYQ